MEHKVKLGKYRHFKGKEYRVLGVGKQSETQEELVVYEALYENKELWVRPIDNFLEEVKVGDKKIPRFKFIE